MKRINFYSIGFVMLALAVFFLLEGCASNTPVSMCLKGEPYGFWGGLWHGFIAPFDLFGMLVWDHITMYAQNNNGAWYAFGFLLGSGGWGMIGGNRIGRKR